MKVSILSSAPETLSELDLPLSSQHIHAGFPSPATDHIEQSLDLNKALIRHPSATFFVRVEGESMSGAGVNSGDILVVDRSIDPYNNAVVVCFLDGEFFLKRLEINEDKIILHAENSEYNSIEITGSNTLEIWGVVTYSIKKHI